jgi:hypothetical protein
LFKNGNKSPETMFSGIQELLVLIVIVIAILLLPRLLPRSDRQRGAATPILKKPPTLPGKLRLALVFSLIWLLGTAAYFKPWSTDLESFLLMGLAPVALAWGLAWVVAGFRSGPRKGNGHRRP